jgi:hypothetical protein
LGEEFLAELGRTIASIKEHPSRYPVLHREACRAMLRGLFGAAAAEEHHVSRAAKMNGDPMVLALIFLLVVSVSSANADGIGCRNPDVPYGGWAIDLLGGGSVSGSLDQTEWDLLQVVNVTTADGLPVVSSGDLARWGYGLSVMTSLSPRVTAQLQYSYSNRSLTSVMYSEAGAFRPPNLRVNHGAEYETKSRTHDLRFRLRVWVGAKE